MKLIQSIMDLKGIGEKNAALFHKLNIDTIGDLLNHFPRDYERYPSPLSIEEAMKQHITKGAILATVQTQPSLSKIRGLSILKFVACDIQKNRLDITFFNAPYLKNTIKTGTQYVFWGAVAEKGLTLSMTQPKMFKPDEYTKLLNRFLPIYSRTKGLTDQSIQKYVQTSLEALEIPEEPLPGYLMEKYQFPSYKEAYRMVHFPEKLEEIAIAQKRFSYEEFLLFLLAMKSQKREEEKSNHWDMIETADCNRLIEMLPFSLTQSQNAAFESIKEDMLGNTTMNRLLQGDVGSGKTIIAILAMLLCISNGYQAAMMAPTEVLAKQHFDTLLELNEKYHLPFRVGLLVGSQTAKEKRELYKQIASGEINTVIGTHAVIQDGVSFEKLALVITDEQHRFGVKQRETLAGKGNNPHTIVMSATPIPRSLAIILYGDLDITEMKGMPSKRLPIKNCVVDQDYRKSAYHFMQKEIEKGRQVFIICPMAEPGVMDELENVVEYSEKIKAEFPPNIQIAYLHGKMKPKQKNEIMQSYADGNIDILVSTTVIEVGINVPNATVMMVENAERFGLASLHQIRGRVGRGAYQAYCIFMETQKRKKKNERLAILEKSNDGFIIASEDLKLRGPGDFMGVQQSGEFSFRFADIYRDSEMLKNAANDVQEILKKDSLLLDESLIPLNKRLEQYVESGYLKIL